MWTLIFWIALSITLGLAAGAAHLNNIKKIRFESRQLGMMLKTHGYVEIHSSQLKPRIGKYPIYLNQYGLKFYDVAYEKRLDSGLLVTAAAVNIRKDDLVYGKKIAF